MKFKDYLNSLVSKRKGSTSSTKSHQKPIITKNHQCSTVSADCHYDICGYEDINGLVTDDQHSRTQILLARHAQLVNTIVGTRSSHENVFPSCTQCRISHQSSSMISPPSTSIPPPLPPKLSLEHQMSFSNRNYSSTLATCSPRRECQQHQLSCHPAHLISSQYSTPNPNVMTSSSSSLWTTATASLSKKQRSRIRTNPWIGNTPTNNRSSIFLEPSNTYQYQTSPLPIVPFSQPEYGVYDPTYRASPLGMIHSESFPQTTSNGNIHPISSQPPPPPPPPPSSVPASTPSVILHQSDSGHGFSLSSSRVIDSSSSSSSASSSPPSSSSSSSSPDNTSSDGILLNGKQHYRQKKLKKKISSISPPSSSITKNPQQHTNTEQNCGSNTISSDSGSLTRRKKTHQVSPPVTLQYRYQRPSNTTKTTSPVKSSMDRVHQQHHSQSSSSRSIDDHFSIEFEEILENERSYKSRKDKPSSTRLVSPTSLSPRKSPFILPLDDTNMKLSSPPPPPPLIFSPTLAKTNSRAILKHIEEIENEIRLIKNLDLANNDDDDDEYALSPHAYPEEDIDLVDDNKDEEKIQDNRESIYEQVDQWVEKCLNTSNNSGNRLYTECDHLSNTIKDYVECICSDNDHQTSSSIQKPSTELMTAFYLSSTPTRITKRTSSFIDQPLKLENTQTEASHLKPIHECPF